LRKLEKLLEEKNVDREFSGLNGFIFDIKEVMPELNAIYSFVDNNFDLGPIVILDSIEAIAQKYTIDDHTLFSVIQNDLVERSGAGLIVVLESTSNEKLEYFSDGVVNLSLKIDSNYMVRTMNIEKLRGLSLGSIPFFSYSLSGGRFSLFPILFGEYPVYQIPLPAQQEEDSSTVNLGNEDISKLTPSGKDAVDVGDLILIHRMEISDRTDYAVNLIKNSLIRRTIADERGVIDASSSNYESRKILTGTTDSEHLKHYITAAKTKQTNPFVINLEGLSFSEDFTSEAIEYFTASSKKPNVYIFSTDFLNFIYGEKFLGDFLSTFNEIRTTGSVFLICDDDFYGKISHNATFSIHIHESDGFTFLNSSGDKHYNLQSYTDELGWTSYKLIESV
jgi:GvpD gas vesicle protein.